MAPINVLVSGLLPSQSLCLQVGDHKHPLRHDDLAAAIIAATGLPRLSFFLRKSSILLSSHSYITAPGQDTAFIDVCIRRALPGGKGGFGAMLKGSSASTKTTNFDACRDLQGRRLRDVRDEAIMREFLRVQRQRGQNAASSEAASGSRPRKRQRSSIEHEAEDEPVENVDTAALGDAMDEVNRGVESAVAAGLRAVAQRKRQRTGNPTAPRSDTTAGQPDWMDYDISSSSDSEESGSEAERSSKSSRALARRST